MSRSAFQHERMWEPSIWGDHDPCVRDIENIKAGLDKLQLWSVKVADSSTKLPSGLLTGNLVDLGNYDECLSIKFPNSSSVGKYCAANIVLGSQQWKLPSLTFSYCMPSSCRASDLQTALNETLNSVGQGRFLLDGVVVSEDQCHISGGKDFSSADIFSISFFSVVFLVCIASTIYDGWSIRTSGKSNALFQSFSFIHNGRKLFSTAVSSDTFQALNGLRFLSIAWVVLGHRYFFMTMSPIMNLIEAPELLKDLRFQLIAGAVLSVDTFFLMSGFLNCYIMLKLLDRTRTFPAFKYYIHRYLRTTPALAVMILIYSTWFVHLGDGPLWNSTVEPGKRLCDKYWWSTILYINNYYNPVEQCAGQSWYLAVDMQLYWLSPLVLIPCWKWPNIGKFYLGFLLTISVASQFAVAYIDKIRMAFSITTDLDEYRRITQDIYVPTHARATPYIIGLILGMLLYNLKKSNKVPYFTKIQVISGWIISACLCLAPLLGNYPFMQNEATHAYNRIESSFYISLHRVSWSLGIGWVIFASIHGYGGVINDILSWSIFVPLSRLSYCIFLCHMAVQQYQLGTLRTTGYFQEFDQVHRYLGDLGLAIICSTLLCLMFESPVINIEKYFETPKKKSIAQGSKNEAYVAEP